MSENVEKLTKNKEIIKEDLSLLKKDAEKVKGDLSNLLKRVVDIGKEESGSAKDLIKDEGNKLIEELDEIFTSSKVKSRKKVKKARKKVEERPFLSLIVAFLVGVVLSKIMNRD